MEDFCSNVIKITEHDIEWIIYYDCEGVSLLGYHNKNISYVYRCKIYNRHMLKYDKLFIFDMFKKYADKTLDTNKYEITFPQANGCYTILKIKVDICLYELQLSLKENTNDIWLLTMHLNNTSLLQNKIKQLEEQVANLNDKFNMMSSFMELLDNNKLAELKKAT